MGNANIGQSNHFTKVKQNVRFSLLKMAIKALSGRSNISLGCMKNHGERQRGLGSRQGKAAWHLERNTGVQVFKKKAASLDAHRVQASRQVN